MHPSIAVHQPGIDAICRQYHVRRQDVFGSAARATDFNPRTSDSDFLVEFDPEARPGLKSFFGAKAALESLLGRPVDLVEAGAVRNPYVLQDIDRCRETIYAA